MAAITAGVVAVAAGAGALDAKQSRDAASRTARIQAGGVEAAQQETREARGLARDVLGGVAPTSEEQTNLQSQLDELIALRDTPQVNIPSTIGGRRAARAAGTLDQPQVPDDINEQITALESQIAGLDAARVAPPDPRQELLGGIGGQLDFTGQGFQQSQEVLTPLAQMAQPFLQEQQALLGFGGEDARQQAIGRVADPLQAEQERAIMRNNASLGGVGGNVLSQLAEQTRARTEANIGNRLNQLSQGASPALSALQQISNLRLNRGLSMADIMGGGGRDLSVQETARRQALANVELGQGSELAQLAQNLGTARAGGAAFAAQNSSPLVSGVTSGLNAFTGMGGMGGGVPMGGTVDPNRFGSFA